MNALGIRILVRIYQQSLETHPYRTLAFTNGALNGMGDVAAQLSQLLLGGKPHDRPYVYDPLRTLRFFCFGFGMGPFIGRWNLFLENTFPLRSIVGTDKVSFKALSKRVFADQLFMAPAGLIIFIGSMSIMEGRNAVKIREKYRDMYIPALLANWKVWPLAQLINFRYIPLLYRVPFQSTCGVFWTLYLSILKAKSDEKPDASDAVR